MAWYNLSSKALNILYVAWWSVWAFLHGIVLYTTVGLSAEVAAKDAILTNLIFAAGGFGLTNVMRFYQPRQLTRFAYSLGMSAACVAVIRWLSPYFVSEDVVYLGMVEQSLLLRGLFCWLMLSLISASAGLYVNLKEQRAIEDRRVANETLVREAELSKLRQQLQPHFLFNSLNSISALVGTKPEEARKMIQQLSDFLRVTLKKDETQLVPLAEELQHLELYLSIEKVRFGHRLATEIMCDDNSLSMKIPSLLLQPIVENAIKFGLYDTIGSITIRLAARSTQHELILEVSNPFDPETSLPRQGTGFGLSSVQRRLYLLFARQDLLQTSIDNTTFTTQIKIPQA